MNENIKTPFKVGDKVYCVIKGWCTVVDVDVNSQYGIAVEFYDQIDGSSSSLGEYTLDGRYYINSQQTLSFAEYTLQGFSQERPIELPREGDEIMVSDGDMTWRIATYKGINVDDMVYRYHTSLGSVKYIKLLR